MLKSMQNSQFQTARTNKLIDLKNNLRKKQQQQHKEETDEDLDVQIIKDEPVEIIERNKATPNKKVLTNVNGNTSFKKISPKLAPAPTSASKTNQTSAATTTPTNNSQNFILTSPVSFITAQSNQQVKLGNIQIITMPSQTVNTSSSTSANIGNSSSSSIAMVAKQELNPQNTTTLIANKTLPSSIDLTKLLNAKIITGNSCSESNNKTQIINPIGKQQVSPAQLTQQNAFTLVSAASTNLPIIISTATATTTTTTPNGPVDLKIADASVSNAKRLKQDLNLKVDNNDSESKSIILQKPNLNSNSNILNEVTSKQDCKTNSLLNNNNNTNIKIDVSLIS